MSEYLSFNYHIDGVTTKLTHTREELEELRKTGEWHGSFDKAKAYIEAKKLQAQQELEQAEELERLKAQKEADRLKQLKEKEEADKLKAAKQAANKNPKADGENGA